MFCGIKLSPGRMRFVIQITAPIFDQLGVFRDIYFSLNEIEIALKRISTKWPNGEWTKQIVLSNGKRIRVYCTHPIQVEGTYITEMSEGELGQLYEGDKVPF